MSYLSGFGPTSFSISVVNDGRARCIQLVAQTTPPNGTYTCSSATHPTPASAQQHRTLRLGGPSYWIRTEGSSPSRLFPALMAPQSEAMTGNVCPEHSIRMAQPELAGSATTLIPILSAECGPRAVAESHLVTSMSTSTGSTPEPPHCMWS